MAQYLYVNGQVNGSKGEVVPATITINRQEPILETTDNTVVAVERFYLHGARLPLFDTQANVWTIGIRPTANPAAPIASYNIVWDNLGTNRLFYERAGSEEAERYLYDYRDVATSITNTIALLCGTLSIPSVDFPTVDFDLDTKKFVFNTTDAFRATWDMFFNEPMMWALNTFPFHTETPDWFKIEPTDDVETQSVQTLEFLSPVARIALRTRSLPVSYELLPPPVSPFAQVISDAIGSFLVDYKYTQTNNQSLQGILYSAADADHRWHNMLNASHITSMAISFLWVGYDNVFHQMTLPPSSFAEVKILFKKDAVMDE